MSTSKSKNTKKTVTSKNMTKKKEATRVQQSTPLRITDTTLRDAHQSLWATRMRTSDIMEIIDVVDSAGYYSLECWGGATFDVCLRFLRETPWDRLRLIKAHAKKTPLQMLLRGQNILGYRNYADDVLERFIALAVKNGIDIFRTFDALNDNRNLEQSIKYIKHYGAHAQGTICYTISPVHTVEEYVRIAKEQEQMGIDSLCIKDMAGILSPVAARDLVSALVKEVNVPIQVHTHATSGMGVATYLEAVNAGAGAIDCAVSAVAGFSSQPPVETMISIFAETEHATGLDTDAIKKINTHFMNLAPLREPGQASQQIIDPDILEHKIPGGMISNLRSQLEQQGALDRLPEVLKELPQVRADMGYPPLVTPTSQIVGVQAVLNVLSGKRYEMVTQETRDYVKGLYGSSPATIDKKIQKKILGDDKPITKRPADLLRPGLPGAVDKVEPSLINSEEDILSFCLFPEPALAYFKWRAMPPSERSPIPADEEMQKKKAVNEPVVARPIMAPSDYVALEGLMTSVKQLGISELTIRRSDVAFTLKGDGAASPAQATPLAENAFPDSASTMEEAAAPAEDSQDESSQVPKLPTVDAPLTGTFYRTGGLDSPNFVEEGGTLKGGEPICIIEAMKLFNQIKVEKPCKVIRFLVNHGEIIEKGTPFAEVEYL
ncbi:MAG: pyruvate carboxylase subunit B [Lentisphaerae bacterium]|jgi:oxaloacetate decarboxylase alpha subunit|nr:pyruvate carboxylase subunit B [Lentisphaerota bacterium]